MKTRKFVSEIMMANDCELADSSMEFTVHTGS